MSRWSYYDTDEERLPEGFQRIGYDADSQTYTFRDTRDGSLWEGPVGVEYGELRRIEGARILEDDSSHDYEDTTAVHDNREAWRYMFPFFVLIGLFLLGVWKIVTPSSPYSIDCKGKSIGYKVQAGDSCWSVADAHKIDVEDLKHMNPSLDCDPLVTGKEICVPRS